MSDELPELKGAPDVIKYIRKYHIIIMLAPRSLVSTTITAYHYLINNGLFRVLIAWKEGNSYYLVSVRK